MIDKTNLEILICDSCGSFLHAQPIARTERMINGVRDTHLLGNWVCLKCQAVRSPVPVDRMDVVIE